MLIKIHRIARGPRRNVSLHKGWIFYFKVSDKSILNYPNRTATIVVNLGVECVQNLYLYPVESNVEMEAGNRIQHSEVGTGSLQNRSAPNTRRPGDSR